MPSKRRYQIIGACIVLIAIGSAYILSPMWLPRLPWGTFGDKRSDSETVQQDAKNKILATTQIWQKIFYKKCGDTETTELHPVEPLVGLPLAQLQKVYPGWQVERFDAEQIVMQLQVDGYCQEHANHFFIGIKDGYVAVYYGRPDKRPILKEITKIKVDTLLPGDVQELEQGMVFESKEELLRTLEGMQSR